jgi:hypothetical protein
MAKVVGVLVTVALLVAGCGSAQREAAAGAAEEFLTAVGDDDMAAACALLAPDTRQGVEASEHAPCEEGFPELSGGDVGEVEQWGDRAQARSDAGTVFLVELDTGWRISAAGCEPSVEDTYECTLAGS